MSIRPMTREDLPAVASLAARSFHHSTWTPWLSPTQQHLEDATEGYKLEYKLLLSDNSALCTVYEIENTPSSYAAAVKASEGEAKKIVGVVVWIRAHGDCGVDVEELRDVESKYGVTAWSAEMKGELSRQCISQEFVDRSIDMHRSSLLSEATHALQRRYFTNKIELDNMAVDPSCFRQRIGTKLMHHGLQIARKDKVDVGIIAARSGMPLYESLGFRMAEVVELADDRVGHEAIVELCVCLWSPVVCETAETKEGD